MGVSVGFLPGGSSMDDGEGSMSPEGSRFAFPQVQGDSKAMPSQSTGMGLPFWA